ncbi:MAG: hypothetical protein P1U89_17520 [Verrucomicrobiales bacterium]|nr:hypothetical protein [Verrucomicrobiales bacterium]
MPDVLTTQDELDVFLDLLKQLVHEPSVVGGEVPFFRVLQRELEALDVKVTWFEGLLVACGSNPGRGMLSAHIDRNGLICTGPDEFQYAAFVARNRGDLTGDSISEQTFFTIADRFQGERLHAYDPWSGAYLGKGEISHAYLCERRKNMIFQVQDLAHLSPGTPVAFWDKLRIMDEGARISGQLDNVLSVAMLLFLFQCGYEGTAFFTAREEAGKSWRFLMEWFLRTDTSSQELIVLDTSPYADREAAETQQLVLRRKDAGAGFSEPMVNQLVELSKEIGATYSFKDEYIEAQNAIRVRDGLPEASLGRTELGRIIEASQGAITGATLQIPTTGYHTPNETAAMDSVRAAIDLLRTGFVD